MVKGLYPISAVDEVTPFEVVFTVERISEQYLIPALEALFDTFSLNMILDVWSRKIVAAKVFPAECARHSAELFVKAFLRDDVDPKILTRHSDNGSPMKGSTMLAALQRLGVVPSFSHPGLTCVLCITRI